MAAEFERTSWSGARPSQTMNIYIYMYMYYIYIYYIYYIYIYILWIYRFSMTLWHKVTLWSCDLGKVHISLCRKSIYQGAGYTQNQTKGAILQELLDLQILKRPKLGSSIRSDGSYSRADLPTSTVLVRSISFDHVWWPLPQKIRKR